MQKFPNRSLPLVSVFFFPLVESNQKVQRHNRATFEIDESKGWRKREKRRRESNKRTREGKIRVGCKIGSLVTAETSRLLRIPVRSLRPPTIIVHDAPLTVKLLVKQERGESQHPETSSADDILIAHQSSTQGKIEWRDPIAETGSYANGNT